MEGIFVYWIGWSFWVVVSFFWAKSSKRFFAALSILIMLIILPLSINIGHLEISIAFILFSIYLCSQIKLYKKMQLIRLFIISTTIAGAYGGFQMILIYDPVIEYIDSRWMSASLIGMIAFILSHSIKDRFITSLFGLVQGELLTKLVLKRNIYIHQEIGSLYVFDVIAILSLFFSVIWLLLKVSTWASRLFMTEQKTHTLKRSS
ncbi:YphA family membrane protein [Halalkalibacter krulwichiae]|uniref:Uncharacterized protein n=1 Tax=Halalkalibacter krulwichiae TaxID=199441 RepID=A0A1X9MIA3_9BACI|nr:hypothetical protein [Halalkalibacter krulwichiae]ARK30292.1 hypothetical protein BkAM31D_10910 [Halalkalibacter krulwichiae]